MKDANFTDKITDVALSGIKLSGQPSILHFCFERSKSFKERGEILRGSWLEGGLSLFLSVPPRHIGNQTSPVWY